MIFERKLQKIGGSLVFIIPVDITKFANWHEDTNIEITVNEYKEMTVKEMSNDTKNS